MRKLFGMIGRTGALALLLALFAFTVPDRADAAMMQGDDHAHHAADHSADPAHEPCADCDESAPLDGAGHAGHGCHCVSAACTPVMPPHAAAFAPSAIPAALAPPVSADANPLASVDPPSEPPRA